MDSWPIDSDLSAYRDLPAAPRAVVLLLHGFGEHAQRHAATARALAERGIAVYAYDHRGHGRSPGRRALVSRFRGAVDDSLAVRQRAAREHPDLPLFLMGASMGGLMAVRSAQADSCGLAGVILVAPALAVGDGIPAPVRALGRALGAVAPAAPIAALELDALSRDPDVVAAYAADPLNHHGKVPARTAGELVAAGAAALAAAPHWRLPLYIVHGDADRIATPSGTQRFVDVLDGGDVTLRLVPGAFHEPFNEPGGAMLVDEVSTWILDRAARGLAAAVPLDRPPPAIPSPRYTWRHGLAFGAAVNVAARLLGANAGRYQTLKRPWFAPPGWVFPVVWGINSTVSIAANVRVLNAAPSADRTAYLRLWAATWLLYIAFGYVFFRRKSPLLGALVTANFSVLAVVSAGRAARLDRRLLWAYSTLLPWLGLATSVALAVALDNPDPLLDAPSADPPADAPDPTGPRH